MVDETVTQRLRTCITCGEKKEFTLFGWTPRNFGRRNSSCKACVYARQRAWHKKVNDENRNKNYPSGVICCRECKIEKATSNFRKKVNSKTGITTLCDDCWRARERKRYRDNVISRKANAKWMAIQHTYGLKKEEWVNLFEAQKGKCAICEVVLHASGPVRITSACVDHNHNTGAVRGILCRHCNTGLGQLKDNVTVLEKALAYLRKFE